MKTKALIVLMVMFLPVVSALAGENERSTEIAAFSGGVITGYSSGFKVQLYGMISNFAEGFPMNARISAGYAFVQPGNAADARRIFINNATNGIPEKKGRVLDFKLDLMYPVNLLSMKRAYLVGGVRHARFKSNFKFIGGNEDFDVTSNEWGVGFGLESFFRMSRRVDFILSSGLDYFFKSTLTGHDTSYSPDDVNINPREDYTYSDADEAIDQPKLNFSVMFGFCYNF